MVSLLIKNRQVIQFLALEMMCSVEWSGAGQVTWAEILNGRQSQFLS